MFQKKLREILERLVSRFDVDKNGLYLTTLGRMIIDEEKSAITALVEKCVGEDREVKEMNNGCICSNPRDCFPLWVEGFNQRAKEIRERLK